MTRSADQRMGEENDRVITNDTGHQRTFPDFLDQRIRERFFRNFKEFLRLVSNWSSGKPQLPSATAAGLIIGACDGRFRLSRRRDRFGE